MVVITNNSVEVDIDAKYLDFSPYLYAQYDMNERVGNNNDVLTIEDVYDDDLLNYLSFLKGGEFVMDEKAESFFDFMGHSNTLQYPLDYWKVKLRSRWIRYNFYRLELWRDPFYGLVEMTACPDRGDSRMLKSIEYEESGVIIAGGYVLYLMGITSTHRDIDLFSTDKEKSIAWYFSLTSNTELYRPTQQTFNVYLGECISLIRRVYRSPAEVVHGFDLDSCQFLAIMVKGELKIYGTEIGVYATRNMVNWLDPDMASTTYLQRLGKYQNRGFGLRLPLITIENVDISSLPSYCPHLSIHGNINRILLSTAQRVTSRRSYRQFILEKGIPHDLGSILVYMAYGNLSSTRVIYCLLTADLPPIDRHLMMTRYDAEYRISQELNKNDISDEDRRKLEKELQEFYIKHREEKANIRHLPWIEIDPMSQGELSAVMYPIKYDNLSDIYQTSPLYVPSSQ